MDATRFDALAKVLAGRLSRRAALTRLGAASGVVGAGVAASRAAALGDGAIAREAATPTAAPAGPDGGAAEFLFVQTFSAGTLAPKAGEDGTYVLTLESPVEQTVYFSDRPERIVGAVSTDEFLEALGFSPTNPPNAALVAQTDAGEDVVVLELLNPRYTRSYGDGAAPGTLTYDVRVLADYQGTGLASLAERRIDDDFSERFGAASLFIDDCPDLTRCVVLDWVSGGSTQTDVGPLPGGPVGTCWEWLPPSCKPCNGQSLEHYADLCNEAYSEACEGLPGLRGICLAT
jgi:hypothetical protein